jgi:hypothetical protein
MPTRYTNLRKLLYMDFLIRLHNTGSANEFAKKLGISRSTFFEYKALLRDEFDAEIKFLPYKNTYVYTKPPKSKSILQFFDNDTIKEALKILDEA